MYTSTAERHYNRQDLPDHISNEQHVKLLVDIEHNLWVLCDHFKVFPPAEKENKEKPPEQKKMVFELELALDPKQKIQQVVEKALRSDGLRRLHRRRSNLRRKFRFPNMGGR